VETDPPEPAAVAAAAAAAAVPAPETPGRPVEPGSPPPSAAREGSAGSSRGFVIAAAVVIGVVALGGLVTWGFLRNDAPSHTADTSRTANDTATPAQVAPEPVVPPAVETPAPTVAATVAEATPLATPLAAPAIERPSQTAPRVVTGPAEKPVRATRTPVVAPAAAPMQDVALSLVRKGESAFSRQDYSTAIANARAALEVNPGLARAKQLLDEAQRAQQQAMSSISIQ
jgi:hypothetical protein